MQRLVWGHEENLNSIDRLSCHGAGCMQSASSHSILSGWKMGLKQNSSDFVNKSGGWRKKKQQQEKTNKQTKNPQGSRTMAGWSDKSERKEGDFRGAGSTGRGMMSREMEWELDKETSGAVHPSAAWPGAAGGVKLLTSVWTAVSGRAAVHQGKWEHWVLLWPQVHYGRTKENFGGNRLQTMKRSRGELTCGFYFQSVKDEIFIFVSSVFLWINSCSCNCDHLTLILIIILIHLFA